MNTNAAEALDVQSAALDALLADLDMIDSPQSAANEPDEVVLEDDEQLEAAVNAAEAHEALEEHYINGAAKTPELTLEPTPDAEGLDPTDLFVEAVPIDVSPEPPKKEKRGKKASAKPPVSEVEEKKAGEAATPEKKKAGEAATPEKKKVERKHYTSRLERMKDLHSEKLGEYFVLELADAELGDEELVAKQKEFEGVISGLNKKRQARANLLIDYVAGRTAALNNVIATCFRVLATDGKIVTGDKGNLHQTLLAHPYSAAAARAMGNNSVAVLEAFKVIEKTAEGFVPNPNSLMLLKVNAMLGLAG